MTLKEQKAALRREIRKALKNITPTARDTISAQLCLRLKEQLFWKNAGSVLFFAPLPDEPDVWPLLEEFLTAGKICTLPFYDADKKHYGARQIKNLETDLAAGKFGVREPLENCEEIPLEKIDLTLVPGRAFDLSGNRVGRGLGFYDRLLEKTGGVKCGVGYDFQLLEKISAEPHDAKVDFIFTPTRCVEMAD